MLSTLAILFAISTFLVALVCWLRTREENKQIVRLLPTIESWLEPLARKELLNTSSLPAKNFHWQLKIPRLGCCTYDICENNFRKELTAANAYLAKLRDLLPFPTPLLMLVIDYLIYKPPPIDFAQESLSDCLPKDCFDLSMVIDRRSKNLREEIKSLIWGQTDKHQIVDRLYFDLIPFIGVHQPEFFLQLRSRDGPITKERWQQKDKADDVIQFEFEVCDGGVELKNNLEFLSSLSPFPERPSRTHNPFGYLNDDRKQTWMIFVDIPQEPREPISSGKFLLRYECMAIGFLDSSKQTSNTSSRDNIYCWHVFSMVM